MVCNVMRLDRWKDPHAVIDAYAQAKREVPELQLVLVGALPGEGPQDFRIAREVADYAAGIPDVRLLTSYTGVGEVEVGALQRVARASLQRSLREGFGLAASEGEMPGRNEPQRHREHRVSHSPVHPVHPCEFRSVLSVPLWFTLS